MDDRTSEIIAEARAVVAAIEDGSAPLSRIALRALRLAQLVDDDATFIWLWLECNGQPVEGARPERPGLDAAGVDAGARKFTALRSAPDFARLTYDDLRRGSCQRF